MKKPKGERADESLVRLADKLNGIKRPRKRRKKK